MSEEFNEAMAQIREELAGIRDRESELLEQMASLLYIKFKGEEERHEGKI
jgi:hypothetical protein